jgi:pimeloyl-[acyl-carrier protein] methyl ester esterase
MGTAETTPIILLPGMDGTGELLKGLADQLARHRRFNCSRTHATNR